MRTRILAATAVLLLGGSPLALGQDTAKDAAGRQTELFKPGVSVAHKHGQALLGEGSPPLYAGLGDMSFKVTTSSPQAQAYFDQGLRFTWAFNHAEARRAFQEAQRQDPSCAMAFWGEAFVLGPNINDGMREGAIAPAFAAITRALELKGGATAKEQALIEALAQRYAEDPAADRVALNQAWATAMGKVAAAYAEDVNIQVFYADSLMNLQPWDYWEADKRTPKGKGGEIVAVLERTLARDPNHPAAIHLYIHAVEASTTPERAEPYADRLRGAMPAAGHLTHMPSHIYNRVGRYADSIAINRDAVAADEALLAQAGEAASPIYRHGYYPHNLHFLMVAAQMAGAKEDVITAAEKLGRITSKEVSAELAWVQAIQTAPYAAHAQFSDLKTILALPAPDDGFPFVKGFWHYARGTALARERDIPAASAEAAAIERLIAEADMSALEAQALPARDVLGIAKHTVQAAISQAQGDLKQAEHQLHEAIALQDKLPYIEPPFWYYPVRQTLGAVLLQQGRAQEAVAIFTQTLAEAPRNGWAVWGLMQAQQAAGDVAGAKATRVQLQRAWLGDPSLLRLDRL